MARQQLARQALPEPELDAASLVYTKAPQIIRAFDQGAVIRNRRGQTPPTVRLDLNPLQIRSTIASHPGAGRRHASTSLTDHDTDELCRASVLEGVHELPIASGDLGHGGLARGLFPQPVDQRFPKNGATNRKADEAPDCGRRGQPFAHLPVVLAAAQDDAADVVTAAPAGDGHDPFAILTPIEALDLPDVDLDLRVLQLFDRPEHQLRAHLQVVDVLVPAWRAPAAPSPAGPGART